MPRYSKSLAKISINYYNFTLRVVEVCAVIHTPHNVILIETDISFYMSSFVTLIYYSI
jgi:hypothetical protein